ncbi:MAG: serine/threonine protein kinase [Anaerolineae bacterium]|jgi:serine/threonine-protein kinase|nr:serine/threonine protein kinase [Anaerolineae bacterium]
MREPVEWIGRTVRTYAIHARAGAGGQSVVYQAVDTRQGEAVALKIMRPDDLDNAEALHRFEAEAAIMRLLRHPCIVPVYDTWTDEHGVWMVLPWYAGGSLRRLLADGPLSLPRTVALVTRLAQGLAAAHAIEVIHRDLKPDNILFDAAGQPYLSDFGAARRLSATSRTLSGTMVGTPGYAAPEVLQKGDITPRVDVFSLAVVLYEALTGSNPFFSHSYIQTILNLLQQPLPDVCRLRPELPAAVNAVLQQATAKDPAQRYATPTALAHAFRQAAGDTP